MAALSSACLSPLEFKLQADEQAYALVASRREELFAEDGAFTIDPPEDSLRAAILHGDVVELVELDLAGCLDIAAENNREYQRRKEALYLAALDLTLERWRLGWIATSGGEAGIDGIASRATNQNVNADLGLSKVLGTGAQIVGGLGLALVNDLTSNNGFQLSSDLSLFITQPLMRGAGKLIVYEPLTQAERNLVYEVRTFERYRRELAFDLAGRLLRLYQDIERINNEQSNYDNIAAIRERNEALSNAGRLSAIQVDQALQNELTSADRLIVSQQAYENSLDNFKLLLGLPIHVILTIDPGELERLANCGLPEGNFDGMQALKFARTRRPDFLTAVDRVVDAERQSRVIADALRAGLDVTSSINVSSDPNNPVKYNFKDVSWSLGIALDLPTNRLPQRNAYRAALIRWQLATRTAAEFEDTMATNLRAELRAVKARRESTKIQKNAVTLAERRVESVGLNQQAGRASTRDLLESQDSLVASQNAEVRAQIDLTLARLELALDLGLLRVDEDGIRIESVSQEDVQEVSE